MGHRPGGGIKSRNVTQKPVRIGAQNRAVSKKWVSQIGSSQGNRAQVSEEGGGVVMTGIRADPFKGRVLPSKLGNQVASETVCGVGGSRQVLRSGQQAQHGNAVAGKQRS